MAMSSSQIEQVISPVQSRSAYTEKKTKIRLQRRIIWINNIMFLQQETIQ